MAETIASNADNISSNAERIARLETIAASAIPFQEKTIQALDKLKEAASVTGEVVRQINERLADGKETHLQLKQSVETAVFRISAVENKQLVFETTWHVIVAVAAAVGSVLTIAIGYVVSYFTAKH